MTKQFRLLFSVPDAELQSFTASLGEAGFSQLHSEPAKINASNDNNPNEMAF